MRLRERGSLTADERSFRNAKLGDAFLISYKTVADLGGKGALFVITIFAARRLSPEAFGIFSLGSTLGWIVAVTSDFGIQLHLAREVARKPQEASRLLASWLRVRLWTAAAAMALVAIGLVAAGWSAAFSAPIAILALVYACSGLIELLHYFYRGLSRSDLESSLTLWQRAATLLCALAAIAWWPDPTVLACAMLLPVAVTLAISVRIATRLSAVRRHAADDDRRYPHPDVRVADPIRPWTALGRDVWPIGAGVVLSALYFRIDVLLVELWSGTAAVARYNAVFRLVEALRLFPAAVLAVALPALCRAGDVRPLLRVAVPITAGACAAAAVLALSAGWLVPLIYGAPYVSAVPAFRILLWSFPLMSLNFALTHQLVGWNGERAYACICALALAVNLVMNARLIPAWSIDGAAWATLGTELFLTAGCVVALWTMTMKVGRVAVDDVAIGARG